MTWQCATSVVQDTIAIKCLTETPVLTARPGLERNKQPLNPTNMLSFMTNISKVMRVTSVGNGGREHQDTGGVL